MAIVTENNAIGCGVYVMGARLEPDERVPAPGQFYMLRGWGMVPLLSRPISVFNYTEADNTIYFMYQVVGTGTQMLSRIGEGSYIQLDGPNGTGFPDVDSDLTVVGGGVGIASLYYVCRAFKQNHPDRRLRAYLGYSRGVFGTEYFEEICDEVNVQLGGYITDALQIKPGETVMCCGPSAMMEAVALAVPAENPLYLSLESRMACGLGACLGCVQDAPLIYKKTPDGPGLLCAQNCHVKICTQGPVFLREVIE